MWLWQVENQFKDMSSLIQPKPSQLINGAQMELGLSTLLVFCMLTSRLGWPWMGSSFIWIFERWINPKIDPIRRKLKNGAIYLSGKEGQPKNYEMWFGGANREPTQISLNSYGAVHNDVTSGIDGGSANWPKVIRGKGGGSVKKWWG